MASNDHVRFEATDVAGSARRDVLAFGTLLLGLFMLGAMANNTVGFPPLLLGATLFSPGFAHLYHVFQIQNADDGNASWLSQEHDAETVEPDDDPVSILETRYASGDITEEAFERRLERLVDLESVGGTDRERETADAPR